MTQEFEMKMIFLSCLFFYLPKTLYAGDHFSPCKRPVV